MQSQTADDRRSRVPDRDRADHERGSRAPRTSRTSSRRSPAPRRCRPTGTRRWSSSRSPATRSRRRTGSIPARTWSTAVQNAPPRPARGAVRQRQLQQGAERDLRRATWRRRRRCRLPITLLILVIAFGSLVAARRAAAAGDLDAWLAAMALVAIPSQIFPVDSNLSSVILLIGLAVGVDYSLFYLRREREERAAGARAARRARGRRGDLGAGRPDLRPDRDRRDGRACSSAATRPSSPSPRARSSWSRSR